MISDQEKLQRIQDDLKAIQLFTADQNQEIQALKGDIVMLSEVCTKESTLFKEKFGDEWKNLASIQHTLKVINTNLLLLNKKIELNDLFIADIYERMSTLCDVIGTISSGESR